tara:strand:- start:114 stop:392 length:279 start_codon:yes stop_codon:yes gene_type:complete
MMDTHKTTTTTNVIKRESDEARRKETTAKNKGVFCVIMSHKHFHSSSSSITTFSHFSRIPSDVSKQSSSKNKFTNRIPNGVHRKRDISEWGR